ncbi:DUF1566 domain-containing protein [Ideonella sp. YS5]|uniref:Lcl C-terminal domain-containing protein n=1 Tax=Ideonella sp. YS5 TaxID=3453714 RepID=UPI003EF03499
MQRLLSSCAAACASAALGAAPSAASAAQTSFPRLLNDTGSVTCYVPDRGGTEIPCDGTGQDGQYGRDVTDWRKFDGRGGFSYRKISSTGEPLPASATEWACVQDRITGLMWEMKTADGGLHDGLRTYTQLNNGDSDDVSGFVREANQAGLCGHNDWRLPARMELQSIIDLGHHAPLVVDGWFPNTPASYFWASTKSADDAAYWSAGFKNGAVLDLQPGSSSNAARLVRGKKFLPGEHAEGRYVTDGDKVTDSSTGLVWRRCPEGMGWDGVTCAGDPLRVKWRAALDLAHAAHYDGASWRLPNATELFSLVDDKRDFPAIDVDAFPGIAGMSLPWFWTATPELPTRHATSITAVWHVDFMSGSLTTEDLAASRAVRLVRVD